MLLNYLNYDISIFEGCIVLDDIYKVHASEVLGAENEKVTAILFNNVLLRTNSNDTPIITTKVQLRGF
jgi:hypothetical protein